MAHESLAVDQLYLNAEALAEDFSLFPRRDPAAVIKGLLTEQQIAQAVEGLRGLEVDAYIAATVAPTEESTRPGAEQILQALGLPMHNLERDGPYLAAELVFNFAGVPRRIGFITQDRAHGLGVWGPRHHQLAARKASEFAIRALPIVCFMDTPGADPYEEANAGNQAHAISRLIAELCNVDVPTLGIVIGQGYSGGAIPLAAGNLLLSLKTGVFNTIHPKGLANLVRRYNLSWQECAKFVGVSSYELYTQGNIDGIIDYDPGEDHKIENLRQVIVDAITSIEATTREFVLQHPEVFEHYHRNIRRYLEPSPNLEAVHASSTLKLRASPTEYPNLFGATYRYLRYLGLRRRIKSTTVSQYGRLADAKVPQGELAQRLHRERRLAFLGWLQDPDKILYEDALSKAWKQFQSRRSALGQEPGRLAQLTEFFFGEPGENYEKARKELCLVTGLHLYNRWKASAQDNLTALIAHLGDTSTNSQLLAADEVTDAKGLLEALSAAKTPFHQSLKQKFSFAGKRLFNLEYIEEKTPAFLAAALALELNLLLESAPLHDPALLKGEQLSADTQQALAAAADSPIPANRRLLEDLLWGHIERKAAAASEPTDQERNILDVIQEDDVKESFGATCRNLILFNQVYGNMILDLAAMAREASESRTMSREFIAGLLEKSVGQVAALPAFQGEDQMGVQLSFAAWVEDLGAWGGAGDFLKAVEEWIRVVHIDKSDTLFVVVSFFFEKILPEYFRSLRESAEFVGKIEPGRIGRRKDFWNRLTIAYRDLLFNDLLNQEQRRGRTSIDAFLARYVDNFEEQSQGLMSANPVSFPTFRPSIEAALAAKVRPHGLVTGLGDFKAAKGRYRVGLVLSNVAFQAGSIDNSDCQRFCHLLRECAMQRLPLVCFISSGGMQTKEGAAALFTMAVINDRITRFVRDNDLPVIMFGHGHCTGGAQASFVTHPLAQTYYFTGTRMPFAGQAVVERNLPYQCMLSNYLSLTEGAMQGLVRHPFAAGLDAELRRIDPAIPLPSETVEQVVERIMEGRLSAEGPVIARMEPKEEALRRPVKKVLIHARGCTAVKLVTRAKALGLEAVLIQSDPDMDSVPAELAQEDPRHTLVCIGGNTSDESYLNALSVISIAEAEGVDALHPGIGFLSEDPNFARLVRQHGINFIGPKVASMETMGNKSNAINTTLGIKVPVVPGSHGIVDTSARAAEISDQIGYPVLLKAVHGGGGKGIQLVERPEQLHNLFHQVGAEARAAFGNGDLYIEKYVTSLRHIEAQLLRDAKGNTKVIGLRDCSVQRNNQKLMEESGSTLLPARLKKQVLEYTERIAEAVDYIGVGTVEFIYDIPSDAVYFMEMNTRLQVEHPVTEAVTGVDIVEKQFQIAAGKSIAGLKFRERGYALEVRVNAEKAVIDADGKVSFAPTPGEITRCELPADERIRLISMAAEGKVVSPFYDSLIIQIICHGDSREDAIERLAAYLQRVVINGVCTNIPLLRKILKDKQFRKGDYDTSYLPSFLGRIDAEALAQEIEEASGAAGQALSMEMLRIEGSAEIKVLSPSTGVFYRTPSPSEPEYVSVGDVVSTETILCQLEAMKMFTPVSLSSFSGEDGEVYPASARYEIRRINVVSGQQVNEGDLLFVIQPKD